MARQHTPLFISFLVSGQDSALVESTTDLALGFDAIRRDGLALQYDRDEIAAARAVIASRRRSEGLAFFDAYAHRCLESCQRFLALAAELGSAADAGDGAPGLRGRLSAYFDAAIAHATFLQTLVLTQFELEDALQAFVASRTGSRGTRTDAEQLASALKLALEPTHEVVNLTELLEIGAEVQRTVTEWPSWPEAHSADLIVRIAAGHQPIWDRILEYERRFAWMGRMYYAGRPIAAGDVVVRLQNILLHDCADRRATIGIHRDRALEERRQAIVRLGGDSEAQQLADVVSSYMHLRSYRLDAFFIAHEHVCRDLQGAAREIGLSGYDAAIQLGWRELLDGLDGRECDVLPARAAERARGFSFRANAGKVEWAASAQTSADGRARLAEETSGPLEGVTACPGIARGAVRLILGEDDMLAMELGEVLVTTMTMPSLMLAVEKAAAIVTDEGGMLCHAAIVSRELDLPCVIATGDATRRLRTGDLVEVDASHGVVRLVGSRQSLA